MALFREVADLAETLAAEPGRLKKRAAIAKAIAAVHAAAPESDDAGLFALYLSGTPFAEADPRKLNAGGALLTKALLSVSGATSAALHAAYKRHGDLGAAAFDLLHDREQGSRIRDQALALDEVATAFAAMVTAKTTAARAALVEGLLRRATPLEAKYLLKLMSGDMRIGVKQSLVEEAIAVAAEAPVAEVRNAVMLEADLASALRRAFAGTLAEARMRLFHPLGFMLASPVDSPEEAAERFANKQNAASVEAFLEDKYDGMRAQVHCGDAEQPGRVTIYSRNREDVTESFPDLAEAFAQVREPLIFDGEILGWDIKAGRALPFAVLGQRIGRKRVSNEWRQQVPVVFIAFDLMYAGGELLLNLPLGERRNRLEAAAERLVEKLRSPLTVDERKSAAQTAMFMQPDGEGVERMILSPARLVQSAEDIERAYADARARANEGVMLKAAASEYQPGRRGLAWVKLKRELATLDVVVTGAELGHGKRAGILSDYTFAVRSADSELLNVGKAYSGLTDAEIAEMSAWMMEHTLEDQGYFRTVEPLMVLEVAFNNIMRSNRHASGFALRFPRIIRIRTDKPVSEIDTVERVEEIYQSQVDKPVENATSH
ncbi:ATP-dependent DNA ligase [Edaphobacter sp. DSM 109919]|uniref:DNA ligase n=1 Tax=Edaphobacter paludis TaxID=3035702 RepID=A0AAU7CWG4_9BACT